MHPFWGYNIGKMCITGRTKTMSGIFAETKPKIRLDSHGGGRKADENGQSQKATERNKHSPSKETCTLFFTICERVEETGGLVEVAEGSTLVGGLLLEMRFIV